MILRLILIKAYLIKQCNILFCFIQLYFHCWEILCFLSDTYFYLRTYIKVTYKARIFKCNIPSGHKQSQFSSAFFSLIFITILGKASRDVALVSEFRSIFYKDYQPRLENQCALLFYLLLGSLGGEMDLYFFPKVM